MSNAPPVVSFIAELPPRGTFAEYSALSEPEPNPLFGADAANHLDYPTARRDDDIALLVFAGFRVMLFDLKTVGELARADGYNALVVATEGVLPEVIHERWYADRSLVIYYRRPGGASVAVG